MWGVIACMSVSEDRYMYICICDNPLWVSIKVVDPPQKCTVVLPIPFYLQPHVLYLHYRI